MPKKSDAQKQLMTVMGRVNFALPKTIWERDLARIKELIDEVLQEG